MDTTAETHRTSARKALLRSLTRELFQTETSAVRHCRREAERLGEASAARPLRAISQQAEGFLRELPALMERHGLPTSAPGMAVGALFSEARDKLFDRLIRLERSYRGTMLGVRHGVDLVQLYGFTARAAGLTELTTFCERWLNARRPLVSQLEVELGWFAENPEQANKLSRHVSAGRPVRQSGAARGNAAE